MEKLEIHLNNSSGAYFPGQVLSGKVSVNTQKPQIIKSIDIRIHGETVTYWKHYNTTFREHIVFSSKMVQLDDLVQTWNAENNNALQSGNNEFPFTVLIPQESPPSFEGKHGSIRYKVQVEVARFEKKMLEAEKVFSVMPYLDLNFVSRALVPVEDKKFIFRGPGKEDIEVKTTLPQRGYIAGETVPVTIAIKNPSSSSIKNLSMKLIQVVHFEAQQDTGHMFKEHFKFHHNTIENEILEVKKSINIKKGSETVELDFTIPEQIQSSFKTKLIQIAYKILIAPGSDKKLECELPLIIGTVSVQPKPPTYESSVKSSEGCPPSYPE